MFSELPRVAGCQAFWRRLAHPPKSHYLLEHVCQRWVTGKLEDTQHGSGGQSRITGMASDYFKQLCLKFSLYGSKNT